MSYDDACYFTARRNIGTTPLQVLGRGWARLDGAGAHDVKVAMDPNDAIVSRGHRLGLVIVAAARADCATSTPATPRAPRSPHPQLVLGPRGRRDQVVGRPTHPAVAARA